MWNIIILGLASLLTDLSSEMVYPLLPLFLATLPGVSTANAALLVGLIEGVAETTASLLKVISGRRADRTGRRKRLTMAGYAGSTLGKLCFVVATAWPAVLVGRLIDRFGKGIRTAPRDALLADAAPPEQRGRVFGLHRLMDTVGALLGVVVAFLLIPTGAAEPRLAYNRIFLLSLIPAALGVAVLALLREARKEPATPPPGATNARPGLLAGWQALDGRLRGFLIVALLFTLGNSSNQFLLLRAQADGFDAKQVLLLYMVYNVAYALLAYPAGRLSDRIGRRTLLVAGYLCYGLVYLGFGLLGGSALWLLFATYGAYVALTEGVEKALIADLAPLHLRATLIGLHATVIGIGLLPASLLAGLLWRSFGPAAPFLFGGLTGLLAAIAISVVLRTHPRDTA